MAEFSELIRTARERKGIRAYDLAYRLGQVPSWMTKLENGTLTHPPAPNVLSGLSEALDVPETEMLRALGYLGIAESAPAYDELSASIARATTGWTPRQKRLLWAYVESVSAALDERDRIAQEPNEQTA